MGVRLHGVCQGCGRTSTLETSTLCWKCYRKDLVKDAPLPVRTDRDLLCWVQARDEVERLVPLDLKDHLGIRYDSLRLILRSIVPRRGSEPRNSP